MSELSLRLRCFRAWHHPRIPETSVRRLRLRVPEMYPGLPESPNAREPREERPDGHPLPSRPRAWTPASVPWATRHAGRRRVRDASVQRTLHNAEKELKCAAESIEFVGWS